MRLKKRHEHYTVYSKQEAIDRLYNDRRVSYIDETEYGMIIVTKPVRIKPKSRALKKIMICPIGRYEIILNMSSAVGSFTKVDINRIYGPVSPLGRHNTKGWHTHHIANGMSPKICWGTAGDIYIRLENTADWYWMTKLALELITDGEPEDGMVSAYRKIMLFLQFKYAKEVGNLKWQKELRKIIFKETRRVLLEKWL